MPQTCIHLLHTECFHIMHQHLLACKGWVWIISITITESCCAIPRAADRGRSWEEASILPILTHQRLSQFYNQDIIIFYEPHECPLIIHVFFVWIMRFFVCAHESCSSSIGQKQMKELLMEACFVYPNLMILFFLPHDLVSCEAIYM